MADPATYDDASGGLPPVQFDTAPDLASLQYPWTVTPPPAPALQPGIGVPAAALDAAAQQSAPEELAAAAAAGEQPPTAAPLPLVPAAPGVRDLTDFTVTTEPANAPGPDAISGAGGMPPSGTLPGGGGAYAPTLTPEQHYQQTAQAYAANPLAIPDEVERQRRLNELNPYQLAEVSTRDAEDRAAFTIRRRRELADADAAAARQHLEDWKAADAATQAKMDATLADADRIANTKIDPTGGLSQGQTIAGAIASVIGGLVQGKTGAARNAGLDAFEATINRGIEAQKADLINKRAGIDLKRNVLAAEFARHGDMYQAEEAVRLASWKHVDDILAFEQQNYDPRGRTALLIANQRQQITGAIQKAALDARQKLFDNTLKAQTAAREQQVADQTAWHNRAQIGLGYAQLNEQAKQREEARAQREADKATERADKEAERRRQFAIGGVPRLQTGPDGKPAIGPDGKPVVTYDDLRNADGSVWEAESPEATRELRQKKTAASEVISIIDEIRAIRDRVGGESKLLNSDESQRLQVLQARAKLLTKSGTQGMSSDKDMETLEDASGTSSATSWRSQEARLAEARARTESALNVAFRDAKYSGPPIAFPEGHAAPSSPAEDEIQKLLQKPDTSLRDEVNQEIRRRTLGMSPDDARAFGGPLPPDLGNEAQIPLTTGQQAVYDEVRKGYSTSASTEQRRAIAELGKVASGSGPGALEASAKLQRIATDAHTSQLRSLASAVLDEAQQASLPSSPPAPLPDRQVSYETLPPPPLPPPLPPRRR